MKKLLSTLLAGCLSLIGASAAVGPGSGTNRLYISYTAGNNANYIEVAADNALGQARISSGLAGATKPLRPLVLSGNGTTLMLIVNTNGNVGIWTNNPAARLHIHGSGIIDSNLTVKKDIVAVGTIGAATNYFTESLVGDAGASAILAGGLWVSGGYIIASNIQANYLTATNRLSSASNYVSGGMVVGGVATLSSDANIGGAANVTGDITTYANGSVLGTLGVGDLVTLSNGLAIPGFDVASNKVWVCTNSATGEGHWASAAAGAIDTNQFIGSIKGTGTNTTTYPSSATNVGLTIAGQVGQTTNVLEVLYTNGAVVMSVDSDGAFNVLSPGLAPGMVIIMETNGTYGSQLTTDEIMPFDTTIFFPTNSSTNRLVGTNQFGGPVAVASLPSAGDVLTHNGTAWVSSNPPSPYSVNITNYPVFSDTASNIWSYSISESNTYTFDLRVTCSGATNFGSWQLWGTAHMGAGTSTNLVHTTNVMGVSDTDLESYLSLSGTTVNLVGVGAAEETNRWVVKGFIDVVPNAQWVYVPPDPASVDGMLFWFKADAITEGTNAAELLVWPDSSGNSYDIAQDAANRKPKYYTNLVNGYPAVFFDGAATQDALTNMSGTWTNWFNQEDSSLSVFMVVSRPTTNASSCMWCVGSPSGINSYVAHYQQSAGNTYFRRYDTGAKTATFSSPLSTNFTTLSLVVSNINAWTWLNGTADSGGVKQADAAALEGLDRLVLGSRFSGGSYGDPAIETIAEFIMYTNGVSTADRLNIEEYLRWKYATW